jgi:hypothetical protein
MEMARIMRSVFNRLALALVLCLGIAIPLRAQAQFGDRPSGFDTWLGLQAVPSMMVVSHPGDIPFAFEWEATPVLYSFGMTKLVSPWHSFRVVPPARFTGSIELKITGQVSTRKTGSSYFGS